MRPGMGTTEVTMHISWVVLLILALVGCQEKTQTATQAGPTDTAMSVDGMLEAAPSHGAVASEPPAASAPQEAPAAQQPVGTLTGKVAERLDAGPYTYLRLTTASGEMWAAVPACTVVVGQQVTVGEAMPMDGFESKTLHRKFDKIVFGMLAPAGQASQPPSPHGGAPATTPTPTPTPGAADQIISQHAAAAAGPAEVGPIKVEKAPGPEGRTVAEVFSRKAKLKDQTIAVRGKVVKINANIMGLNWIHLRDGTGKHESGNDDLTVTSQSSSVAVGDVVLVRGTLRVDKNFGAGYSYPVILEEASVTK